MIKYGRKNRGKVATDGPKISFELVENRELRIRVDWNKGDDITLFGHLLVYLCQGKLIGAVANAVMLQAQRLGETEKGMTVSAMLMEEAGTPSKDEPVVCPTNCVRVNMGAFRS